MSWIWILWAFGAPVTCAGWLVDPVHAAVALHSVLLRVCWDMST